jgi:hypothetical protein
MTMAVTAPSIFSAPALTGGSHVVVVEVPDNDVPPPGWGQWESLPAVALEPLVGVLVMREDGCVMSGRPVHGAEASSSRAALPTSDSIVAHPEEERERVNTPPAHFADAQAEKALWQEFHDHCASLNRALNEALRIHGSPTWHIFRVCDFSPGFAVFQVLFLQHLRFL